MHVLIQESEFPNLFNWPAQEKKKNTLIAEPFSEPNPNPGLGCTTYTAPMHVMENMGRDTSPPQLGPLFGRVSQPGESNIGWKVRGSAVLVGRIAAKRLD